MNKFVIVALIAAILIGGMIMVSCSETACSNNRKCEFSLTDVISDGWCDNSNIDCFGKLVPKVGTKCTCK